MNVAKRELSYALEFHAHVKSRFETYLKSEGKDTSAERSIADSVRPGLYEHWKSREHEPKFYIVYGAGCEQDLYTPLVAYAALYAPHAGHLTYRHLLDEERGFLTPIQREEYRGPRFRFVVALTWGEIDVLRQHRGELMLINSATSVLVRCRILLKKSIPSLSH